VHGFAFAGWKKDHIIGAATQRIWPSGFSWRSALWRRRYAQRTVATHRGGGGAGASGHLRLAASACCPRKSVPSGGRCLPRWIRTSISGRRRCRSFRRRRVRRTCVIRLRRRSPRRIERPWATLRAVAGWQSLFSSCMAWRCWRRLQWAFAGGINLPSGGSVRRWWRCCFSESACAAWRRCVLSIWLLKAIVVRQRSFVVRWPGALQRKKQPRQRQRCRRSLQNFVVVWRHVGDGAVSSVVQRRFDVLSLHL